jgi:hypothetical protein
MPSAALLDMWARDQEAGIDPFTVSRTEAAPSVYGPPFRFGPWEPDTSAPVVESTAVAVTEEAPARRPPPDRRPIELGARWNARQMSARP